MSVGRQGAERGQEGYAVMTALLLLVVLAALGTTVTHRTRLVARHTIHERGRMHTWHAARGGIDVARLALAQDGDYRGEALAVGRCRVELAVERRGPAAWRVTVVATDRPFGVHGTPFRRQLVADLAGADVPALRSLR